jgi:16S rRNA (cytidine1402-2'-O)-methyltransferase
MPKFFVIGTPIGNLDDISIRALKTLKEIDILLCEDTRVTKRLLSHYQIKKPVISYHAHSNQKTFQKIINLLKSGKNLGLVSDAGTPGISDPGNELIAKILKENIKDLEIIPIPGASAITTALSVSAFNVSRFAFFGFPPSKRKRKKFFEKLSKIDLPIVIFESKWRLIKTLNELKNYLGERDIFVCHELTKKFESFFRGNLSKAIEFFEKSKPRGEFVIVINKK